MPSLVLPRVAERQPTLRQGLAERLDGLLTDVLNLHAGRNVPSSQRHPTPQETPSWQSTCPK